MRAATQVSKIVRASREIIYEACLSAEKLALWRAPENMKAYVHVFDGREGGSYRMSLTYTDPKNTTGGKTSEYTDTFQGKFTELVPYEKIVELIQFESPEPTFGGEMRMTTTLVDVREGTEVTVLCENLPAGIRPEDNELGCRSSLRNLARLVEYSNRLSYLLAR
ncbi:MAG TPA: SRPBCC family protein [Bryobacteraceae bacterium]|nr:SRPBCC family protein [Bryobacteraceae bacterium]